MRTLTTVKTAGYSRCPHIELAVGAASVDHFAPKSQAAGLAYEWDNYQLACLAMNAKKNNFSDVLNPFVLPLGVFKLVLETGQIKVNPMLAKDDLDMAMQAEQTIERLKLDSPGNRAFRARLFFEYKSGDRSAGLMARYHPFVWSEIVRLDQQ